MSLYLYFVPFFQGSKLAVPFFLLLLFCAIQPLTAAFAILFAALFYGILLIKHLIVIDRKSAHEMIALVMSFLLFRYLYINFQQGIAGDALFFSFLAALAFALLINSLFRAQTDRISRVPSVISFILMWQALVIGLFLPLDYVFQSAIAFLVGVLLIEFLPDQLSGILTRARLFATSTAIFALFIIIIGSARWGL